MRMYRIGSMTDVCHDNMSVVISRIICKGVFVLYNTGSDKTRIIGITTSPGVV